MKESSLEVQKQLEEVLKQARELEQKLLADTQLDKLQSLFKITIEQMHEGIQILDENYNYIYINEAAARHGLQKKETLLNKNMLEMYPGIENTEFFQLLKKVNSDKTPAQMENHFTYPSGEKRWFQLYIEPHITGVLIRSFDITNKKILEQQYYQSQKMEAIGRLAGGIAHDFNNKLSVMSLFSEMALAQLKTEDEKIRSHLQSVVTAIEASKALTKQLLALGHRQMLDLKILSLNDIIMQSQEGLSRILGENISLSIKTYNNLYLTFADSSQIDQILLNLCINARDAMPKGGRLIIETSNIELDDSYCKYHDGVSPGAYVMLSISDNGTGMDANTKAKMFDPFFTTKEIGKGTGLGLSSVHGIVKQSRGHIWVYSELGIGTTFKIYFPKASGDKTEVTKPSTHSSNWNGSETVLLVEDDPQLQLAFKETLSMYGYQVVAATSAEEAEEIFLTEKDKITLLLTDLTLPKMNGRDLSNKLLKQNAQLKVIYTSGYSENLLFHERKVNEDFLLLEKPITTHKLVSTIRKVIDGENIKGIH